MKWKVSRDALFKHEAALEPSVELTMTSKVDIYFVLPLLLLATQALTAMRITREAHCRDLVMPHVPADDGTTTRLYFNRPRGIARDSFG